MIGSTRLRLLALHSSSVSHACTPKLERRTRCRYSPRSRRATGPCCQSKPESICVWLCAVFPDQDQLMLGSVERSHAGVALVPHANVFELVIDRAAGHRHFEDVPPVDADIVD